MTEIANKKAFDKIKKIKNEFPELTFDNVGYQYLPIETREEHKDQINEMENILKEIFPEITEFNNFKPRKDGGFSIRCQGFYDQSFKGVFYIEKSDFNINN